MFLSPFKTPSQVKDRLKHLMKLFVILPKGQKSLDLADAAGNECGKGCRDDCGEGCFASNLGTSLAAHTQLPNDHVGQANMA